MTVLSSVIKKLSKLERSDELRTKIYYPKLVLFEDATSIRILDLEEKENHPESELLFKLEDKITGSALQDHFLWVSLKSDAFLVINLINGKQIKVSVNNYCNLKLHEMNTNSFYFKSDGGEYLKTPYSTKELVKLFAEDQYEHIVLLKKLNRSKDEVKQHNGTTINGLLYYVESGSLVAQCPLTGLKETIFCQITLSYGLSWGNYIILADKSRIWIIDMKTQNIVSEFGDDNSKVLPVVLHNNIFYYLIDDDLEVLILFYLYKKIRLYLFHSSNLLHSLINVSSKNNSYIINITYLLCEFTGEVVSSTDINICFRK